ncbi:anti-sigma factor [Phycisphaeraceae bacterium D3-23]
MTDTPRPTPEQIEDLLALRATQGLDAEQQQQYDQRIAQDPAIAQQAEAFEIAAASATVALGSASRTEALPDGLRQRLATDAAQHVGRATQPELKLAGSAAAPPTTPSRSSLLGPQAIGWYVAIAALLGLAFVLFSPAPETQTDPDPTPTQQYAQLADDPTTVAASWGFNAADGDTRFANVVGEVIFNADQQAGYMKLTGLPVNDPTKEQYQLWIVDAARAGQTTDRIDGGVFDVSGTGEVIIPVTAAIRADQPVVFAITVEKPGGVVVSKGPLQVVAAVE